VARKSFSKLRSAIAGVYVVRGLFPQAETAFKESLDLYPLSPEANFRLADLYLRWNRAEDAYRLMAHFFQQDPGNTRSGDFARDIKGRIDMTTRIGELEKEINFHIQKSPINTLQVTSNALELCELFHRLARQDEFANMVRLVIGAGEIPSNDPARALMRELIERSGMHPNEYLRIAQWTMEERRFDLMEPTLKRYLALIPADWRAWIDLATVRMILKNQEETIQALQQALRVGGEEAKQALREDRRFEPIRRTEAFQKLFGRGLPLPHADG
jgi:tetratricopeptide (TPR) repeat protein